MGDYRDDYEKGYDEGMADAADEIERLREEQKAMLVTMRDRAVEIERLRTDLEVDKYAMGHYRDRIAKLEKVLEAAKNLEWGAADPNLEKAAKAKLENAITAAEADNEFSE